MAKSIKLSKSSTIELPDIFSYKLVVKAVQPQGMSSKIFVNQRTRNFAKGLFEDTFVAVCTPVQLEDFSEDSPSEDSSYYRTDSIELVTRTPELLSEIFESLKYEVKKLVTDLEALDDLGPEQLYDITGREAVVAIPAAPTIASVIGGYTSIMINFVPAKAGSIPIKTYEYSLDGGQLWNHRGIDSTASPIYVTQLHPWMTFNVKIRAVDFLGNKGLPTQDTVYAYTIPSPDAPTISSVAAADAGELLVSFIPAAAGANPAATNYAYSTDAGNTWTERIPASTASPLKIEGLSDNTNYSIRLRGLSNGIAGGGSNTVIGRTASVIPPASFWTTCTATLGVSKLISNLDLCPLNFTSSRIGDAVSGMPGKWIVEQNTTIPSATDVSFEVTGKYSKMTLVVCYRNDYVDAANPGIGSADADGNKYPYIAFLPTSNISAFGIGSFVRLKWNGVKIFEFLNQASTKPLPAYLPSALKNYGDLGRVGPGQTGSIVIEIEAQGDGAAAFSFLLGYN
jgi:hypothetical protein